jgi:hypothetical protein
MLYDINFLQIDHQSVQPADVDHHRGRGRRGLFCHGGARRGQDGARQPGSGNRSPPPPLLGEGKMVYISVVGSGSALILVGWVQIRINFSRLDPDPHWEYGYGSRRAKMTHKSEENESFEVLDVLF